jgi:lipid-A-disaccharide synthase
MIQNNTKTKKIMIFAGEASGDLQGAMLARELKKLEPDIQFSGFGGIRMKEEGIHLFADSTTLGVVGLIEGLKLFPKLLEIYKMGRKVFLETRPDLAIFIDTPAFNMRLAKLSQKNGIRSVYYFPPSAWSGSIKRAEEIASSVELVVNTFEFASQTYTKAGIDHFYTGHPLLDYVHPWKNMPRQKLLEGLNLAEGPRYTTLMPGSRTQELKYILPLLTEVGEKLAKKFTDIHFLIPIASPLLRNTIEKAFSDVSYPVTFFDKRSSEVIAVADLIIMASGSAALEAAILEKPMIITYRLNHLDYNLIKLLVKIKWAGLPNLILQRDVIPELLQDNATVDNICSWAEDLLQNGVKKEKMIKDLREVNKTLGEPGVVERVAMHIRDKLL